MNPVIVLAELEKTLSTIPDLPNYSPFGDGKASRKIVNIIDKR